MKVYNIYDYINIVKTIIKEMKIIDKNLQDYLINIELVNKVTLAARYELHGNKYFSYGCILIPCNTDLINEFIIEDNKACPLSYNFLHSLFKEPKPIHTIIISLLHEFGHLSQASNIKQDVKIIEQKLQMSDYFSKCIDDIILNNDLTNQEQTNYWYRLRPQEIYVDIYAYNYFIKLYNILYKKKIVEDKIELPELNIKFDEIDNFLCKDKFEDFTIKIISDIKSTHCDYENKIISLSNKIETKNTKIYLKQFINSFKNKEKVFYLLSRLYSIYSCTEIDKIKGLSLYQSMVYNMQRVIDIDEMSIFNYYRNLAVCNVINIINQINKEKENKNEIPRIY